MKQGILWAGAVYFADSHSEAIARLPGTMQKHLIHWFATMMAL
jgi:hypothetical protein